jgi:hypothetical protein
LPVPEVSVLVRTWPQNSSRPGVLMQPDNGRAI